MKTSRLPILGRGDMGWLEKVDTEGVVLLTLPCFCFVFHLGFVRPKLWNMAKDRRRGDWIDEQPAAFYEWC